ncbi:DUF6541 family protein [Actinokineospora sp. NBRC 105648]|uniref:DUF6541 family protein n=1 Tax=Actinokineospora sp. NBRC 105648 TaxID=3032206 RepID=UPI0024A53A2D|nr:DUF6541 family protein [Actinokineospora sp. NBRC 105648]GLZ40636.1 hypothetical protein Acsp05_42600 [Actinokineospora sp. NBRC 105648]
MNVLVVLLAFWLPGLVLGTAIRLRGWTLAAIAPALTFGGVSLGVVFFGKLGITWNLLTVAAWFVGLSALGALVVWLVARRSPAEPVEEYETELSPRRLTTGGHLVIGLGVAAGIGVGVLTFLRGIGNLNWLNQDWDAPFHANAIRWIAEHGNASPSGLGTIANLPAQSDYFYPDTYHALLSLVLDRVGIDMPHLLNFGAMAGVIAWPLGVAALGVAWRMPSVGVAAAAAVSTWFGTFPYDSLWRGPLWPYVAGIALVPAVLAAVRLLFVGRGVGGPIAIALATAGLVGLHTSIAFVLAGYFAVILLTVLIRLEPIDWARSWKPLVGTAVLGMVFVVILVLPSLYNAAGVTSAIWPSEATPAEAFGQFVLFSPSSAFPQWWLGIPAAIGLILMFRHRSMVWLALSYLAFGGLYAVTVSLESPLIQKITGPFYNDAWRLAALMALAGALAIGEFVWTITEAAVAQWHVFADRSKTTPYIAVGAAALVLLILAGLSGAYVNRNATRLAAQHHDGPTVSTGEREAYAWLGQHVKPGEHVMNDNLDGSVWMYALAKVQPVEWTYYGNVAGTDAALLTQDLNKLDSDEDVRAAVRRLGVRYAILGSGYVRPGKSRAAGLIELPSVPGVKQVFENADAIIFELPDVSGDPVPRGQAAVGNK